jgi:hypothetical protein
MHSTAPSVANGSMGCIPGFQHASGSVVIAQQWIERSTVRRPAIARQLCRPGLNTALSGVSVFHSMRPTFCCDTMRGYSCIDGQGRGHPRDNGRHLHLLLPTHYPCITESSIRYQHGSAAGSRLQGVTTSQLSIRQSKRHFSVWATFLR